ncbi:MAG: AmmeMemoRadiSam system protein B [Candidatus Methanomethylicia archaeon]|nr:AmmeMemoRadiSam system protein B [Candidatus Methanomethylicia archaeon]MDW7988808.1 AmmeMemoRadiSam system protein B [Nitrososphaerota archaeon]
MFIRNPAVAGLFYEGSKDYLVKQIEWCFKHEIGPREIPKVNPHFTEKLVCVIVPHAGYIYSGPIAAWSYKVIAENGKPDSFIIIGPNHTGMGSPIAVMKRGVWRTPLGNAIIDENLSDELLKSIEILDDDSFAHLNEHSIEVQLPFLQYLFGEIKFVPICLMIQNQEVTRALGDAMSKIIGSKRVVVIASTDFSHYESYDRALRNDFLIIDRIINLDIDGFFKTFYSKRISMCGPGPVGTLIVIAKKLGVKSVSMLKYATSGDVYGNKSSVVGYSSIAFFR